MKTKLILFLFVLLAAGFVIAQEESIETNEANSFSDSNLSAQEAVEASISTIDVAYLPQL
jgi:hypothetical protein